MTTTLASSKPFIAKHKRGAQDPRGAAEKILHIEKYLEQLSRQLVEPAESGGSSSEVEQFQGGAGLQAGDLVYIRGGWVGLADRTAASTGPMGVVTTRIGSTAYEVAKRGMWPVRAIGAVAVGYVLQLSATAGVAEVLGRPLADQHYQFHVGYVREAVGALWMTELTGLGQIQMLQW